MPLTNKRIAELAESPGARTIAVENFLGSLATPIDDATGKRYALDNLERDARVYRWNQATVSAIRKGITEAFSGARLATTKTAENKPPRVKRAKPAVDREWQREQAMQAGMGLGVEAYNDAMGWGDE